MIVVYIIIITVDKKMHEAELNNFSFPICFSCLKYICKHYYHIIKNIRVKYGY